MNGLVLRERRADRRAGRGTAGHGLSPGES